MTYDPYQLGGWEPIWQSDDIPPRYHSSAPPHPPLVEWAEHLPAGASVLDVGCGLGRNTLYLGAQGFRMAGVDISPTGVEQTRIACAAQGIPFDGRVSDFTRLQWPDASFDAAFTVATIHHHLRAGIVQALAEVQRVLKPGGLFYADLPHAGTVAYTRNREDVAAGLMEEIEPNTFVDNRLVNPHDIDGQLPHHFCDEADLRDLFAAFEMVRLLAPMQDYTDERGTGRIGKWIVWARRP